MNNIILWIMGGIIVIILLSSLIWSVYNDYKDKNIIRVGICFLFALILILLAAPFALHDYYPEQFKELMKESVDEEIVLKNINQKDEVDYETI